MPNRLVCTYLRWERCWWYQVLLAWSVVTLKFRSAWDSTQHRIPPVIFYYTSSSTIILFSLYTQTELHRRQVPDLEAGGCIHRQCKYREALNPSPATSGSTTWINCRISISQIGVSKTRFFISDFKYYHDYDHNNARGFHSWKSSYFFNQKTVFLQIHICFLSFPIIV